MDFISHFDFAPCQNLGKDSLFGHHAVTGLVIDGAAGVANFADLGYF
jgi:hypothetical protein